MRRTLIVTMLIAGVFSSKPAGQAPGPLLVGLGDSIGEGVQSANASVASQPFSFIHIIALLKGAPFPQPYIQSGAFGQVGNVGGRSRIQPTIAGLNLAVSGANTADLLFTRADATSTAAIDSETDLVLFPRLGSQMEIAERLRPQIVACWIGNVDALASVTTSDQLDGVSNITPLVEFQAHFAEVVARLHAIGSKVVFGTIPDVTKIGYLLDRSDMIRLTGQDYGLPDGAYTTVVTAFSLRLNLLPPTVLTDPNYVLDQAEAANINQRIAEFNNVIRTTAITHGMGVADTAAVFSALAANPPVLFNVPLSTRFLGGLFSLDGVHPSNVGQLVIAKFFVEAFNQRYGLGIPNVTPQLMGSFFASDPFIDKDGDGRVKGRPGTGLLETVASLIGWSGDTNDAVPMATSFTANGAETAEAIEAIEQATGKDLKNATRAERLATIETLFGVRRRAASR